MNIQLDALEGELFQVVGQIHLGQAKASAQNRPFFAVQMAKRYQGFWAVTCAGDYVYEA